MNHITRREVLVSAAASVAGMASVTHAQDQTMKIIVGFPPGGTTDVLARLVATTMGTLTGRNIIVENKPGASGNIGAQFVAKSAPDANTLILVSSSHGTNASLYKKLPFDTLADFAPIGMVASTPYVLVVHPQLPAANVAQLIDLLKAQPNRYSYASSSVGTGQHLSGELLKKMANVDMTHIPYKGSSAALPDLIGGRTPIMFENLAIMQPHIRSGALRALAITSPRRSALLPDIPTVSESLPGFAVLGWFALLAPAKTPPALVAQLNNTLNDAIKEATFKKTLADLGAESMAGSPAAADDFIRQEIARWGGIIRSANISID